MEEGTQRACPRGGARGHGHTPGSRSRGSALRRRRQLASRAGPLRGAFSASIRVSAITARCCPWFSSLPPPRTPVYGPKGQGTGASRSWKTGKGRDARGPAEGRPPGVGTPWKRAACPEMEILSLVPFTGSGGVDPAGSAVGPGSECPASPFPRVWTYSAGPQSCE